MTNVIETAKAAVIAYNEKNWDKARGTIVEKGVYDEKATGRRLQGINQIIEAWQGWAKVTLGLFVALIVGWQPLVDVPEVQYTVGGGVDGPSFSICTPLMLPKPPTTVKLIVIDPPACTPLTWSTT